MKLEHKMLLIRAGFAALATLAGVGTVTGVVATQRVSQLEEKQKTLEEKQRTSEAKQVGRGCPVCPKEVNCHLKMEPIKGELLFKEKK